MQASGRTGDMYVAYGLGNFVWWRRGVPATGALTIEIDKARVQAKRERAAGQKTASVVTKQTWLPMYVGASGIPATVSSSKGAKILSEKASLMGCSKLRSTPDRQA